MRDQLEIKRLIQLQKELDSRIESERGLGGQDLTERKILALFVELGELANETRCFKFWSSKPPAADDIILEEYVDGLHFILSIGIGLGWEDEMEADIMPSEEGLTSLFNTVFTDAADFDRDRTLSRFSTLFTAFLALGGKLGFNGADIQRGYFDKNKENHNRQEQGY